MSGGLTGLSGLTGISAVAGGGVIAEPSFASVPGAQSVNRDATKNLPALTLTYTGVSPLLLTLTASHASLLITVAHPGAEVITGNGTNVVTITGTKAEIEACVANLAWSCVGSVSGSRSIATAIRRDGEGSDADTDSITVTVVAINEIHEWDNGGATTGTIDYGGAPAFTIPIEDLISDPTGTLQAFWRQVHGGVDASYSITGSGPWQIEFVGVQAGENHPPQGLSNNTTDGDPTVTRIQVGG